MSVDEALQERLEKFERNRRRRALISFFVPLAVAILAIWMTSLYFKHKNVALQVQQEELRKQIEAVQRLLADARKHGLEGAQDVAPITSQVKVKAEAQPTGVGRYRFTLHVEEFQPGALDRIASVTYTFNHPTFSQKDFLSNNKPFQISYTGWGCLTSVIVTFTPKQPAKEGPEKTDFNMCADLRW